MAETLESVLAGPVDRKIEVMTTTVYNMGRGRFGVQEKKGGRAPAGRGNMREVEVSQIRGELRRLKAVYRAAEAEKRSRH